MMKEIVSFLEDSKVQYMATVGLDAKPKVRPFQFMFEEGGRLWFCTGNTKAVYKEMIAQPFIELCASGEGLSWIRIEAKAKFSNDLRIKEQVLEHSPLVKSIYKTAENPVFEVFYLEDAVATISRIGESPKVIRL